MKIQRPINERAVKGLDIAEAMVASAMVAAYSANSDVQLLPYDPQEIPEDVLHEGALNVESSGAHFTIPLLIPEDMESGDSRIFEEGSLSHRDLPISLLWQIKTGTGHDGSVIVGRIDSIERVSNGLGNAKGVFDVGPYGREAERLVRGKFLRGVSADLDKFKGTREPDDEDGEFSNKIESKKISVSEGRVMAATLVPKPAFQECTIELDDFSQVSLGEDIVEDGVYEEMLDDYDNDQAALAASAAPVIPPREWFNDPKLDTPTPLTVTDDGKVFGHIAAWHVSHIGLPRATKPPRSYSNYLYFKTGALRTTDGDVAVGQLTLAGGHAPLSASARDAVKHYDDTASAVADVTAGEDEYGIWVSGALRPEVTPAQVRAFRASAPSGDWRPINDRLELVAVCQVNVPGFPVARTMIAGGQMTALIAAGAAPLAQIRENSLKDIDKRLSTLESIELEARREAAFNVIKPRIDERKAELDAIAASAAEKISEAKEARDAELAIKVEELRKHFNKD